VRPSLKPREARPSVGRYALYVLGRILQVAGLVAGLVAATAFFGTPSTIAMLRMTLAAVLLFVPGTLLVRSLSKEGSSGSSGGRTPGTRRGASR
jgi:hypothetical protein